MKPHIRRIHGEPYPLWECCASQRVTGRGRTPSEAYRAWVVICRRAVWE